MNTTGFVTAILASGISLSFGKDGAVDVCLTYCHIGVEIAWNALNNGSLHFITAHAINCKCSFLAGNHLFTGIKTGRSVIYRWVAADLSSRGLLQTDSAPNVYVLKGREFLFKTIYYICV